MSTFLVYKVKKFLLKSGKVGSLAVPWVPITRALREHVMGIDRPSDGHSLPVRRASSAHFMGWFLGCSFLYLVCSFLYLVDYIVPYSYCKLTIIFSIPNSTCQSSILFLVSIYILYLSLALPPFYEEWMCLLWRLRAVLYED